MNFFVLFSLVLLGFVAPAYPLGLSSYDGLLYQNQTFTSVLPTLPPRPNGQVNVTLEAHFPVEVCIQEGLINTGDLTGCNPGGYFLFGSNNNSTSQMSNFFSLEDDNVGSLFGRSSQFELAFVGDSLFSEKQSTTLRGGSTYFVSLRFANSSAVNTSSYFKIDVAWDNVGCNSGEIGLPDGNCVDEAPTKLTTTVTDTVEPMSSNYYSLLLPSGKNQFLQTTVSLDFTPNRQSVGSIPVRNDSLTVSIRRGAAPTDELSDASAVATGDGNAVLELEGPVDDTVYYIRVASNNYHNVSFSIETIAQGCTPGSFGPNCNSTTTDLTHNKTAVLYTGIDDYQYFTIYDPTLVVGVGTEKLADNAPALLASIFNYPSNQTALLFSKDKTTNFLSVTNPNSNASDVWYISVWANQGQQYYIWANVACPNNCTGSGSGGDDSHGECNIDTGVCACDKGYGDLFCDKTGLKLVWIIIIVIACAIILAVAIGVPIACFLRNRRRARYERV